MSLYLIKPSKYDDDGYIIQYWKGVLPSNTLACLYGLSEDVRERRVLGPDLKWEIDTIDETVQKVHVQKIIRRSRRRGTKTLVGLVGVQSNQFPRARDLALRFRQAGIDVMIGGFHVSGILATLPKLPADIEALEKAGVTLVAGEVEGKWESILRDALEDRLRPVYNFLFHAPDLLSAPMPRIPKHLLNRYAVRHFATLDCGRGCPFNCSFCTIINVQGRLMRFRSVERVMGMVRQNYHQHKIRFYFFTDDNFSRNKNWNAIFEGLTRLREEEGMDLSFMIQVDTQSHRIPDFVAKAARAGCSQVFIGVESVNAANLEAAGKKQNKVADFKQMVRLYHEAGIATHLAYIIGFPFDTEASVQENLTELQNELGAEQASFFMLTPLPGSEDYRELLSKKRIVDADLNNFDSFHETFRHPRMPPGLWTRVYEKAWEKFYSAANMIRILRKVKPQKYWQIFMNFIWYKNAIQVEGGHPMIHGFIRRKDRRGRRGTFPLESRWEYFKRRARDFCRTVGGWIRLALEMEEVWLATRSRGLLEERVLLELKTLHSRVTEWRTLGLSELQNLYQRAVASLEKSPLRKWSPRKIPVPSRFELWLRKWNVFTDSLTFSRVSMTRFWKTFLRRLRQGKIHRIRIHQVAFMTLRESVLLCRFFFSILRGSSSFAQP